MALVLVFLVAVVASYVSWSLASKWRQLKQVEAAIRKQGVNGPDRSPLIGGVFPAIVKLRASFKQKVVEDKYNHDILGRILPDFSLFSKLYGVPYFFWSLHEPKLVIKDPEHVREFLSKQASSTGRSIIQKFFLERIIGNGLVTVDGDEWAHHRRVVSPAFHFEKLKLMTQCFQDCTLKMLTNWQQKIEQGVTEIDVSKQLSVLTGDIISHIAFGSSYEKGHRVFEIQETLAKLFAKSIAYEWIPLVRQLPTKHNRTIWRLQNEVNTVLSNMIQERKDSIKYGITSSFGDDLLGRMLADDGLDNDGLIGECKTFYLAGHETTAGLLSWTLYMLAIYPEWQQRAREEVLAVLGDKDIRSTDVLSRLKLVGMILYETLRLYPPATFISRYCLKEIQLGGLSIPKGTSVDIPVLAIHHDKELWGDDVHEFNPERFINGASRASKHPNAFMAFSFGPRICVGQAFALLESKLVLAMMLQHFSFSLSTSYRHCPALEITLKPYHGVPLVLQSLKPISVTDPL